MRRSEAEAEARGSFWRFRARNPDRLLTPERLMGTGLRNADVLSATMFGNGRRKGEVIMRRLTPVITAALLLAACASGPVVSGDFNEDQSAEGESATTFSESDAESTLLISIDDAGKSLTPADDPLPEKPEAPEGVDEDPVVVDNMPEPPPIDPTPPTPALVEPIVTGEVPTAIMDTVLEYAAAQLNVSPSDVTIEQASAWSWPDTAFGCPEPGKMYSQVLTDGYWVKLSAAGETLDLRLSVDGHIKECRLPDDRPP